MNDPYDRGVKAFHAVDAHNPYPLGSHDRLRWNLGYRNAERAYLAHIAKEIDYEHV